MSIFNQQVPIRVQVPQSYVNDVNAGLKSIKSDIGLMHQELNINQIGMEAIAVYKWIVEQLAAGKVVVATNNDLSEFHQFSTPSVPAPSFNP